MKIFWMTSGWSIKAMMPFYGSIGVVAKWGNMGGLAPIIWLNKEAVNKRAMTRVRQLNQKDHQEEIARMQHTR